MIETNQIVRQIEELGASHAAYVETKDISFEQAFRAACEQNACGFYNRCWACPPDAGSIEDCMSRVKAFPHAVLFQTISELEDSYDIEGMQEAAKRHNRLVQRVREAAVAEHPGCLALGAGTCGVCSRCSKRDDQPCRFPDKAILSLESCGIDVSALARLAGLKYINGANTVTYFGAVLYK